MEKKYLGVLALGLWLAVLVFLVPAPLKAGSADQEWAKLVAAAKQEGRVVIAAGGQPSRNYRPLLGVFQKKFGVKAEMSTGSASSTVNRVLAERRVGRFTIDVGLIAHNTSQRRLVPAGALIPVESLLIPEVTDKSHWLGKRYWYADQDQKYVFLYTGRPEGNWRFWYNTKKISKKEIATIKTLADFFDPKWGGKMASLGIGDPSGLAGLIHLYVAPDAGPDWVRRYIFETDVTYVENRRVLETWLTRGRFPLQFPSSSSEVLLELEEAGLPIKQGKIPMQLPGMRLGGSACCLEAFGRSPHPNAAKLFLNWFLSKEGQAEVNKIEGFTVASLREDVEFGNVHADARRPRGIKYRFDEAEPWRAKASNEAVKQIQEWWQERLARR